MALNRILGFVWIPRSLPEIRHCQDRRDSCVCIAFDPSKSVPSETQGDSVSLRHALLRSPIGRWTRNTCPIDNLLSLIWAKWQANPDFRRRIGTSLDERVLLQVLGELEAGRICEGKRTWAEHLAAMEIPGRLAESRAAAASGGGSAPDDGELDLHGREQEHFLSHFDESTLALEAWRFCPRCGKSASIPMASQYIAIDYNGAKAKGQTLSEHVSALLEGREVSELERRSLACPTPGCPPRERLGRRVFRSQSPWLLAVEAKSVPTDEFASLPPEVVVDGLRFRLAGVTLHSEVKLHFAAWLYWEGRWAFYDGEALPQLTSLSPEVVREVSELYTPNFAVYLIHDEPDPVLSISTLFA